MSILSEAVKEFEKGNYQKALDLFNQVANVYGEQIARYHIKYCNNKLNKKEDSISNPLNDNLTSEKYSDFLRTIGSFSKDINYRNEQSKLIPIMMKIKNERFNEITIDEGLYILSINPFQISSLFLMAYLLKINNMIDDILKIKTGNEITLLDLIISVTDQKKWLENKSSILNARNSFFIGLDNHKYLNRDFIPINIDSISLENIFSLLKENNKVSYSQKRIALTSNKQTISIGSILLNEAKFIGLNLINHYDLCDEWFLIEGACLGYPERKVTEKGLSKDTSSYQILFFPDRYNKLRYHQYGWTKSNGEDAKSELRNQYVSKARGDILWVLDIDEFYNVTDLEYSLDQFRKDPSLTAFTLPQVHFWKGIDKFIIGGYYDISHTRFFKNIPGMKYISNHNFPEINGITLNKINIKKENRIIEKMANNKSKYKSYRCYHMGFAKDEDDMKDKTQYYINRGEDVSRKNTTDSRAGWFSDKLPSECKIFPWGGAIPKILTYKK